MEIKLSKQTEEKLINHLKQRNIDVNDYIQELITKDISNTFYFQSGYKFNLVNSRLYDPKGIEVELSNKPCLILKFLILNKDRPVATQEISQYIWNTPDTSVFTIRNMIKKIRDESYRDIITNYMNLGYKI